jgi:hypothetical protein
VNGAPVFIVAVLIAIAVIAAVVLSSAAAKRRRLELSVLANSLGWTFDESQTAPWREHQCFDCFGKGHSRGAYNTMTGPVEIGGREFSALCGDYTYKVTTSNGKTTTTTTHRFSYLILRMPFGETPTLVIRREGLLDKLAGAVGFDDIDFESEEFSRRFHVKSSDKKFAYDVVSPAMMEFLMPGIPAGVSVAHGLGCLSDGSNRWEAAEFRQQIDWLRGFFGLWPAFLTEELDQRAQRGGVS